ncbi:protein takeout-like [Musca autumnalis]|uniref:protein takeout-like n=1 Tax=Musca autumnalis TaxID=221902 RepID=UPI003CF92194
MTNVLNICIIAALTWTATITEVKGAKILTEKPAFLEICKRTDNGFGQCWAKNLEKMFHEWKAGIPGLKSIGSLDPLHVKRAKITQGAQGGAISINMELANAALSGLGGTIVEDAGSNGNNLDLKLRVTVPYFKLTGDYTMNGNILSLVLNSQGKALMTFENAIFTFNIHLKLHKNGENTFAVIDKLHLVWEDNGGMQFHLDNLFGGDKALEDSAHSLLNDNWRAIFEVLRPALSQTVQFVVKEILSKILAIIPTKHYMIE